MVPVGDRWAWRGRGRRPGNYELAVRRFADIWGAAALADGVRVAAAPPPGRDPPPTRLWYDVSDIAALREGELARSQATLVRAQAVGAFVTAGYSRDSAIAAADLG